MLTVGPVPHRSSTLSRPAVGPADGRPRFTPQAVVPSISLDQFDRSRAPGGAVAPAQLRKSAKGGVVTPPVAKKVPYTETWHGDVRLDNYRWLHKKTDPEVLDYLKAENAYTASVTKPLQGFQNTLYKEMVARIAETDLSVPSRRGPFNYYSRIEKGEQYNKMCRKGLAPDAKEEVLLDLNEYAKQHEFVAVGSFEPSDDHQQLAFTLDTTGFRDYSLHVKNLATGQVRDLGVPKCSSVAWSKDGKSLFYVTDDAAKRPSALYRQDLTSDAGPELLYEEKDERFMVGVARSLSSEYLFINSSSHTTSEVRVQKADEPYSTPVLIAPREQDHQYSVSHHGDHFWIITNSGGRNGKLVKAPVTAPGRENWKEVLPHHDDVMLEGFEPFKTHAVLTTRERGAPTLSAMDMATGSVTPVPLPESIRDVTLRPHHEFDLPGFQFDYSSLVTPDSVMAYDFGSGKVDVLKREEVKGYDSASYVSEQIHATASDGTKIPISLVYKKGQAKNADTPVLLTGYGAYGYPYPATFDSNRVSLLDRGVIFAIAHIRGGGELGKRWHDEGRMMKKENTFSDFIAAAEHLIQNGFTRKERLAVTGGSAGGLLMGAVVNKRPDLFQGVLNAVPFVDVVNTMLDESLPLTVGEFEEWGNPKERAAYEYMMRYSPYDNLRPGRYPAMLVDTSLNDSQVMYWEPAKYVAKLRTLKQDKTPLLLNTEMAGGHGGPSGRYDRHKKKAFEYSFLLNQIAPELVRG